MLYTSTAGAISSESHDPLTHVTVQRVVAGERANTQALKLVPNLEVGLSHGDMRLGIALRAMTQPSLYLNDPNS